MRSSTRTEQSELVDTKAFSHHRKFVLSLLRQGFAVHSKRRTFMSFSEQTKARQKQLKLLTSKKGKLIDGMETQFGDGMNVCDDSKCANKLLLLLPPFIVLLFPPPLRASTKFVQQKKKNRFNSEGRVACRRF